MGFVDMRKPVALDWLLVLLCPAGIIAYHGHRCGVQRTTVLVYAAMGFLVTFGLFCLTTRNLVLGKAAEDVHVMQAVVQVDGLLVPTLLTFVLGAVMVAKAGDVLRRSFAVSEEVKRSKERASLGGHAWAPPPAIMPPTADGIPLHQDVLLYLINPVAAAGLYNRRRWGMAAGCLYIYRVSAVGACLVARRIAPTFVKRIRQHVLDETGVDVTPSRRYLDSLGLVGWHDVFFTGGCIAYSLYSIYKVRRSANPTGHDAPALHEID